MREQKYKSCRAKIIYPGIKAGKKIRIVYAGIESSKKN